MADFLTLPKSEKVKVGEKEYEVRELSLRKFSEFMKLLTQFATDDGRSYADKMTQAITFATGIEASEILDLPSSHSAEILAVAIKVNNVAETLKKKLLALFNGTEPTT